MARKVKEEKTRFNIEMSKHDVEEADKVFDVIGISRQMAIKLFIRQVAIQKRIPLDLTARQMPAKGINGNSPDDIFP